MITKVYSLSVFALLLFMSHNTADAQESDGSKDCYAIWNGDTLNIGNSEACIVLIKNNKGLIVKSIENKELNQNIDFQNESYLLTLGNLTDSIIAEDFNSEFVPGNAISFGYLKAEFLTSYSRIDVIRKFRVYPGSPMLACEFFIRKRGSEEIEFVPGETNLVNLHMPGKHLLLKSVEFFDRTDHNNTLVKEHEVLSFFRYPQKLKGNILYAKNLLTKKSLIILKEAPCSFVQLNYPGFDFYKRLDVLSVKGIGVSPTDLKGNTWVKTYSVVLGVTGENEFDFISSLRSYQKKWRKLLPERDEMIMMNTWGDRSKDTAINELFIKGEIDACKKLHITHFQIDYGWQQGRFRNSAIKSGTLRDEFEKEYWQPNAQKFPNGFKAVTEYAKEKGVILGLWFYPDSENNYSRWRQDAEIVVNLYEDFGIRYFKIDLVKLPNKQAEINFRNFLDTILSATDQEVVFNLDLTADNRGGYHYFYEYGNLFLENRYTDNGSYYPFWTHRNLWMLSKYVPPERFQIEFLNFERNTSKYPEGDIYAPYYIPFDFQFAITMMAQPLAWLEGSGLSEKAYEVSQLIKDFRKVQAELHSGNIYPIGDEPSGSSWTGFQSIKDHNSGYIMVFRENNEKHKESVETYLPQKTKVKFKKVVGYGEDFVQTVDAEGRIEFELSGINQFVLYEYLYEK